MNEDLYITTLWRPKPAFAGNNNDSSARCMEVAKGTNLVFKRAGMSLKPRSPAFGRRNVAEASCAAPRQMRSLRGAYPETSRRRLRPAQSEADVYTRTAIS